MAAPSAYRAADDLAGAREARARFGVDGHGLTAAVIDTGIDYHNAALGGAIGPGTRTAAGFDFSTNGADVGTPTSPHGTEIASLIGSDDAGHPGVAPGSRLVDLRV